MAIEKIKNGNTFSMAKKTSLAVGTQYEKRKIPIYLSREEVNSILYEIKSEIEYLERIHPEKKITDKNFLFKIKKIWRDYIIIEFLFSTGVRNTEMRSITFHDIDRFIGKRVVVKTLKQKVDKYRIIPLNDRVLNDIFIYKDLWQEVWDVKKNNTTELVFPLSQPMVNKIINKWAKKAQIQKQIYGALTFRHSFAVNCVREGLNIEALRQLMGHSSVTVTQIYFRMVQGEDSGLVRAIKFFDD